MKCFLSTLRRGKLKTQRLPVILYLWLRKIRAGKSLLFIIVMSTFCFQNDFRPHLTKKFRFRYGFLWTVRQTETKLRFLTPSEGPPYSFRIRTIKKFRQESDNIHLKIFYPYFWSLLNTYQPFPPKSRALPRGSSHSFLKD